MSIFEYYDIIEVLNSTCSLELRMEWTHIFLLFEQIRQKYCTLRLALTSKRLTLDYFRFSFIYIDQSHLHSCQSLIALRSYKIFSEHCVYKIRNVPKIISSRFVE